METKAVCFLVLWLQATYDQLADSVGWSGVATVLPRGSHNGLESVKCLEYRSSLREKMLKSRWSVGNVLRVL